MSWDDVYLAEGLSLGVATSVVTSFLKHRFGWSGKQARVFVAGVAFLYFFGTGLYNLIGKGIDPLTATGTAFANAFSLIAGSEGFYQWLGKKAESKIKKTSSQIS